MNRDRIPINLLALILAGGCFAGTAHSQQLSKYDRERVKSMLDQAATDVRKTYFDPKLRGVDWDAEVRNAKQAIDNETSLNMSLAHIAEAFEAFDDSHTFFIPPPRPYRLDYGFQTFMVGNLCFIKRVRPKSDAEAKGIKPGDQILDYGGYPPTRDTLWKINYFFNGLHPQEEMPLRLRDPAGQIRQVTVKATYKQLEGLVDIDREWQSLLVDSEDDYRLTVPRTEVVGDVTILKFPVFNFDQETVDYLIGDARKHSGLIIDLRGNPGGSVDTNESLLGGLFKDKIKIDDRLGRKNSKEEFDKPRARIFEGKVIVLVDSQSASASEIFARVIQLQKRGIVMGDRSSGSVMEAVRHTYSVGMGESVLCGASITIGDLIMTDGKSLEHTGVIPDEIVLPTAADLAAGRDPVLAHAADELGAKLTPEDAGKMFPYRWSKL